MAITEVVRLEIQTQQAKANMESLNDTINEQKLITIELERELKRLEQQLRDTPRTALAAQRDLNQQINHVKDSISDQRLSLRELQVQQSQTRDIERYTGKQGELGDALKITQQETTGLNMVTGGYASRLRNLQLLFGFAQKKALAFAGSLKVLRTALIATGIGALVVALGLVVAYWEDITNWINRAEKKQREYIETLQRVRGVMESQLSLIDRQITLAEELNESTEELVLKKQEILLLTKANLEEEINLLRAQLEQEKTTEKTVGFWRQMWLTIKGAGTQILVLQENEKLILESKERQAEIEKTILGLRGESIDIEIALLRLDRNKDDNKRKELDLDKQILEELKRKHAVLMEIEALENEFLESQKDRRTQEENAVHDKYFRLIELAKDYEEETKILEEAREAALQEIRDRYEQERIDKFEAFREQFLEQKELELEEQREQAIAELELLVTTEEEKRQALLDINAHFDRLELEAYQQKADAQKEIDDLLFEHRKQVGLKAVDDFITAVGEQSGVGKAAAIALGTIDTYQSAISSYNALSGIPIVGPALGAVAAGAAVAAGLANVKKIVSVKVPGGGGGSGGGGAASTPRPPSFNMIGDRGGVQDVNSGIDGQDQPPARAYVVGNDVTTQQELDRNAVNASGF